jgi:hypothetical protein
VALINDTVEYNSAIGGLGGGSGYGGGIFTDNGELSLDPATVANTTNNTDGNSGLNGDTANIDGSYIPY